MRDCVTVGASKGPKHNKRCWWGKIKEGRQESFLMGCYNSTRRLSAAECFFLFALCHAQQRLSNRQSTESIAFTTKFRFDTLIHASPKAPHRVPKFKKPPHTHHTQHTHTTSHHSVTVTATAPLTPNFTTANAFTFPLLPQPPVPPKQRHPKPTQQLAACVKPTQPKPSPCPFARRRRTQPKLHAGHTFLRSTFGC